MPGGARHSRMHTGMCTHTPTPACTCTHMHPPPHGTPPRVAVASCHALRPFSWLWLVGSTTLTPIFLMPGVPNPHPCLSFDRLFHPKSGSWAKFTGTRSILSDKTERSFHWLVCPLRKLPVGAPSLAPHSEDIPPSVSREEATRPSSGGTRRSRVLRLCLRPLVYVTPGCGSPTGASLTGSPARRMVKVGSCPAGSHPHTRWGGGFQHLQLRYHKQQ